MRSGVSTNSQAAEVTFSVATGTEDPGAYGYTVDLLGDLYDTAEKARITPSGGTVVIEGVLASAAQIQCLGLIEHNMDAACDVQVELFSDTGLSAPGTDTGAVAVPAPTDDPQSFPVVLATAETVGSFRVTITGITGNLEIGGLEIGGFWRWPWITAGLEAGFEIGGDEQVLVGGGSYGAEGEDARTRSFEVKSLDFAVSTTTGLDWQKYQGLTRPFLYVEDADTPASWPRDCFLAVNDALQLMSAATFDRDHVPFRLREAL